MLNSSKDLYTPQDIWGVSTISAFTILRGDYPIALSEFFQPLKDKEFKGVAMPLRAGKVVKQFWDTFCLGQYEETKLDNFKLSSDTVFNIKSIASLLLASDWYLLSRFPISRWKGRDRSVAGIRMLCDVEDSGSINEAYQEKQEKIAEANTEYRNRGDQIYADFVEKSNYIQSYYATEIALAKQDEQSLATKFSNDKIALSKKFNELKTEISNKEISADYTQSDKQKELDDALIKYQQELYGLSKDYYIDIHGERKDKKSVVLNAEQVYEYAKNQADYEIKIHNLEVEYNNRLKVIDEEYYAATEDVYSNVAEQEMAKINEEFENLFLRVSCYDAMLNKTRLKLSPVNTIDTGNPPFLCNKVCVREAMAKFADLESTKVLKSQDVGHSTEMSGVIVRTSKTTGDNGELEESDPIEVKSTLLYYSAYKYADSENEYTNITEEKAKSIILRVDCTRKHAYGELKKILADVFIRVRIVRPDKPDRYKLYHARVEFSRSESEYVGNLEELAAKYEAGRKELAQFDEAVIQERYVLDKQVLAKRSELEQLRDGEIAEIQNKRDEDIIQKRKEQKTQIDDVLLNFNSQIASKSDQDEIKSLQAQLYAAVESINRSVEQDIRDITSQADTAISEANTKFRNDRDQYQEEMDNQYSEFENRNKENRDALEREIRESIGSYTGGYYYETWTVDIADLMNQCYEKPEVEMNSTTGSGHVNVSVEIEKVTNYSFHWDWRYLTGADFSKYIQIAEEQEEIMDSVIPTEQ